MSVETGQTCHGFKLVKKGHITELKSEALQFEHEATGAELLILENDDDNKVFGITFRTPPSDDTGVAHIMEHSVLCGSKKYPVKEPFIELVKGSLQTFLNAMTFPDKTMYPLASRNLKDFYNLMNVYLDAVFYPRITEETFMQEGWHHELNSPKEDIVYKGVVFNEMKGVFSSPESLVDRYLSHSLFPDTTYGYESGGDPKHIPDLTYAGFKEFHKKYYHPSNSRMFIYGDGDTMEHLKFLQENYLKNFSREKVDSSIQYQPRFSKPQRAVIPYSVSQDESLENKTFIVMGFLLDKSTDHEHCLSFSILSHLLLGTPASPLRKALIDSGLGSEIIGGGFDDNQMETIFAVGLKGTKQENEQKIADLIFSTLEELVKNGIEKDMVEAAVNTVDFKLREANFGGFPKGIVYNIQALGSWLYDADPLVHLRYDDLMHKIKTELNKGYFEQLIQRYLLENSHRSMVVAYPERGLTEKEESQVRKKLSEIKSTLGPDQLDEIVESTQVLQKLQNTPDSPKALATLPKLGLEDINREIPVFPIEVKKQESPNILFHDLFTNKIAYVQVGFDTPAVPMDSLQYLPLLGKLILEMGTKKHSYVEIAQMLGIHTGGVNASHFSSVLLGNREHIISYVFFKGKSLMEKLDTMFDIFAELFTEYDFNNPKRLVEIIRSEKADMESSIVPHGNQYVLSRLQSYQSRLGKYDELTDGITYFRFMEDLLRRVEKNPDEVADQFRQVAERLFTRENTLVNITSQAEDYPQFEKNVNALVERFADRKQEPVSLQFNSGPVNEGFLTASTVQYVGKGANLYDLGFEYTGKFDVLKAILSKGFLWEKVRMQGGAYGSSASFDYYTGDFDLVSYRDPNLKETLAIYDEICGFIENLDMSQEELTKFIIGCVGQLDPPLTADRKGSISMVEHLTGLTFEHKQKRREELLSTQLNDLKSFAPLFASIKERGNVCVLGNEEKVKQAKPAFDHLVKVFN